MPDPQVDWDLYRPVRVLSQPDLDLVAVNHIVEQRSEERRQENERLLEDNNGTENPNSTKNKGYFNDVTALRQWVSDKSWSFCEVCHSVRRETMLPSFKTSKTRYVKNCDCAGQRYHVPKLEDFQLVHSVTDQRVLRIFRIDTGEYLRPQHGYRRRTEPVRLTVITPSVEERLTQLRDDDRVRLTAVFHRLRENEYYNHFYELAQRKLVEGTTRIPYWTLFRMEFVEMAIWPLLYLKPEWCESGNHGGQTRLSAKRLFHCKVMSGILDFGQDFSLLQYQFDRWLFKTVSGAVESGKALGTSPKRALESKTFTTAYWQWQHYFLKDAVRQFGYPSLFITISPAEWRIPVPKWLDTRRGMVAEQYRSLPYELTVAIMHTLEQVCRGYLTGTSSGNWRKHVLSHTRSPANKNVEFYFYRFEFQKRGTPHLHMLVWLKSCKSLSPHRFSATVPVDNCLLKKSVCEVQSSGRRHKAMHQRLEETKFEKDKIIFQYTNDDVHSNRRAYIDTIVGLFDSHMDVQCADGRDLLLQYTTSYVSKMKDHDVLYESILKNVSGYDLGNKYLGAMLVNEPEMICQMAGIKISSTAAMTKKFRVPWPHQVADDATVTQYLSRDAEERDHSFLQFLRRYKTSQREASRYKRNQAVIVGLKFLSYFNPSFPYQHTLMYCPFTNLQDIFHAGHDDMPDIIKYYGCARRFNPAFWNSEDAISDFLIKEGNRTPFVKSVLAFYKSLHHTLQLYEEGRFNRVPLANHVGMQPIDIATFSSSQRHAYYSVIPVLDTFRVVHDGPRPNLPYPESESEDEDAEPPAAEIQPDIPAGSRNARCFLLYGEAGSGKSYVTKGLIQYAQQKHLQVAVACPTGKLASTYSVEFPDVRCDTVHCTFNISVNSDVRTINWGLANVHFIVVDEVTQVSTEFLRHVLLTRDSLPLNPVLLFCGDRFQLQPLVTVDDQVTVGTSLFTCAEIRAVLNDLRLNNSQFRLDDHYREFLFPFRTTKPPSAFIDQLNERRLCGDNFPTELTQDLIRQHLTEVPETLFLVLTREDECFINRAATEFFFSDQAVRTVLDEHKNPLDLHIGLPVVVTQNRCKATGYVNGTTGIIRYYRGHTWFIESAGKMIPIFPIYDGGDMVYPLRPGYASTVHKIQGQTLRHVTLVFNKKVLTPGVGYVAVSRVRSIDKLITMFRLSRDHFRPVK